MSAHLQVLTAMIESRPSEAQELTEVVGLIRKVLARSAEKRAELKKRESWRRHADRMTRSAGSPGNMRRAADVRTALSRAKHHGRV